MNRFFLLLSLALAFCLAAAPAASPSGDAGLIGHDLSVSLDPDTHRIDGTDTITLTAALRAGKTAIAFTLHSGLEAACLTEGVALAKAPAGATPAGEGLPEGHPVPAHLTRYVLQAPQGAALPETITLSFKGEIHHAIEQVGEEYARSFSETPGIIGPDGVFLAAGSGWYPNLGDDLVAFTLAVSLPEGWDAVSQGERTRHEIAGGRRHVTWSCPHPQDNVYLTAGPFTEYSRPFGAVTAYAFLRTPDAALAGKYLETTGQYLDMFGKLIGPYPYTKFALVENFWETGYGMPSFTLLGPKVIRFPFILHSSFPHEILHNWWGNGVYVDPDAGNWCEGLTAYLADHLIKEQQGQGAD